MAKKYRIRLSPEQRQGLEKLVHTGRESAAKITRARILLLADESIAIRSDREIRQALGVAISSIERIRKQFVQRGLEPALQRRPQPPRPQKRRLDGLAEAKLTMLACSKAPAGHEHWTLDLLADRLVQLKVVERVSRDTVARTLKKTCSSRG